MDTKLAAGSKSAETTSTAPALTPAGAVSDPLEKIEALEIELGHAKTELADNVEEIHALKSERAILLARLSVSEIRELDLTNAVELARAQIGHAYQQLGGSLTGENVETAWRK